MKRRDVAQYGVLEEFVASTCECVDGLLTLRHRSKLQMGLRGRLVLELLRGPRPDAGVIQSHLKRISIPYPPSTSASATVKSDAKLEKSVESFHALIGELLDDPVARFKYFQEQFPEDYGPAFQQALEKLMWEFLIRLDQLLPVPSLAQTVSWLCETPEILEQCGKSVSVPEVLKLLLEHQSRLGYPQSPIAFSQETQDSDSTSLSLPPSGTTPGSSADGNSSEWSVNSGETAVWQKRRRLVDACLSQQPKVVLQKLAHSGISEGAALFYGSVGRRPQTPSWLKDWNANEREKQPKRESQHAVPSSPLKLSTSGSLGTASDDYVPDSEDENTKKFKERLFNKRYCKTKHGTYLPTLREFWKRKNHASPRQRRSMRT
ncbi:TERF1-interacting nuclear factor 2 isoform X2 [Stigmatopora argus]